MYITDEKFAPQIVLADNTAAFPLACGYSQCDKVLCGFNTCSVCSLLHSTHDFISLWRTSIAWSCLHVRTYLRICCVGSADTRKSYIRAVLLGIHTYLWHIVRVFDNYFYSILIFLHDIENSLWMPEYSFPNLFWRECMEQILIHLTDVKHFFRFT